MLTFETWSNHPGDSSKEYWENDLQQSQKTCFDPRASDYFYHHPNSKYFKLLSHHRKLIQNHIPLLTGKNILSLGSGSCWLEASLLSGIKFNNLTAVDFSPYRIREIAPLTFAYHDLEDSNISLIVGDITDLHIDSGSQDLLMLCQAFHHVSDPFKLLREISRVCSHNGIVFITGEHLYPSHMYLKRTLSHLYRYSQIPKYRQSHSLYPDYPTLFPHCPTKGDHHYSLTYYSSLFTSHGFTFKRYKCRDTASQSFVLTKVH